MKTSMVVIILALLCTPCALGGITKPSPFLSRSKAHEMLGRPDIGRFKVLTATLGLRADINDGWEELLRDSPTQDPVAHHIDILLQKNWIGKKEIRLLAEKAIFRSPIRLGFFNVKQVQSR